MSIFSQMKELKEMQSKMKKTEVEVEVNGVILKMNGSMQILDNSLNSELSIKDQESAIKKCHQDAMKQIQSQLAGSLKGLM
jgi:DNA-binding protein YbaB